MSTQSPTSFEVRLEASLYPTVAESHIWSTNCIDSTGLPVDDHKGPKVILKNPAYSEFFVLNVK